VPIKSVQELLALLLVAAKAISAELLLVASKVVSAELLLVAAKAISAKLLLVAGKAISAELLLVAGKVISAELLLVASKVVSAELLLVSGKVSAEVDDKEASGLINVCKELDSSLSTIIFSTSTSSKSALAVVEVSAELMLVAGKARSLCRTEVEEDEASELINVCKELDLSSMLLGAGNEAVSADLLLVALDSTSSTIIFASSSSACNKGEDEGCTELLLVACKEAFSAEFLLLGAGKAVSAELLLGDGNNEAVSADLLLVVCKEAVSAELLLGAGNEAVSAELLLVALDSTSSTIIFASSSSACKKDEDAGCTELD